MVKFEYVPFHVHLNPVSFGAWFIQYQDKPFIGPARTREHANKQLFASLSEGDLRIYLINLRNAEIAEIHAQIKANNESLVPFRWNDKADLVPTLTAADVSGNKPPFRDYRPSSDPSDNAMATLPTPKPRKPSPAAKAMATLPTPKPRKPSPAAKAMPMLVGTRQSLVGHVKADVIPF